MKTYSPRMMLIVSMTVFGTIGLFVRNIPLASGEIALYRAVLAALLIGGYLLLRGQKIDFSAMRKQLPILVFSGIFIFGYLAVWAVIYGITRRNTARLNAMLKQKQQCGGSR